MAVSGRARGRTNSALKFVNVVLENTLQLFFFTLGEINYLGHFHPLQKTNLNTRRMTFIQFHNKLNVFVHNN